MSEDEGQTQPEAQAREAQAQRRELRGGRGRGKGAGPPGAGEVVGAATGGEGKAAPPSQQPPPPQQHQRLRQRRLQARATPPPPLPPQQQQEQQQEERQQQPQPGKQKATDAFRVRLRRSEHASLLPSPATGAGAGTGPEPISRASARHKMPKQRASAAPAPSLLPPAAMTTAPTPPPQPTPEGQKTDAGGVAEEVLPEEPESVQLGSRFVCIFCDGVLPTKEALSNHVNELGLDHIPPCDDVDGYFCRTCCRVFNSASTLERHVLTHPDAGVTECPLCGQQLRTSGEIHRHARAHARQLNLPGVQPRPILTAPKRRHGENNHTSSLSEDADDEVEAKRWSPSSLDGEEEVVPVGPASLTLSSSPSPSRFTCPVCPPSSPFRAPYLPELEAHLEQCHRDYSVPCDLCDSSFKSVRDLNLHRYSAHRGKARQRDVVGFKDLTFVDFSSQKFPQIAAVECEKSLHRPASRQHPFQCECGRAFPCDSALAIHRQACPHTVYRDTPADLSRTNNNNILSIKHQSDTPPASDNKGDFFAKLDLLNSKSTPTSPALSGSSPSRDLADIQSMLSVSAGLGMLQDTGEEEQQDAFAAEFRRMKQRGEFPCLLCTEKFPNLRALKGHNRVHSSAPFPDGYRCNMCPHAAVDKVALQRHMRNHNGDRPYECALCRFAFTTKANCERHLRNRHDKRSREEVKCSIIYHPSEDPGNDPDVKLDARRALFADPPEQRVPSPVVCPPPPSSTSSLLDMEPLRRPSLDVATMTSEDEADRQSPLDLSMVLDLSKKRPPFPYQEDEDPEPEEEVDEEDVEDEQPQDLSRKSNCEAQTVPASPAASLLPQEALPFPALGQLYVNPYVVSQGVAPGIPFSPAFYPAQLPNLLRSLQLGGVVLEHRLLQRPPVPLLASSRDSPVPPGVAAAPTTPSHMTNEDKDGEGSSRASMPTSPKSERSSASDSHLSQQQGHSKMVMKNGVLMPKQKQRRYRTERPHVCEHCSARFTLSSNRERHVKQQHPQFWSQRHRQPLVVRDNPSSPPPSHSTTVGGSQVVPMSLATSTPAHLDADHSKSREEDEEDEGLVIDEERPQNADQQDDGAEGDAEDEDPLPPPRAPAGHSNGPAVTAAGEDLVSVSRLLDNASTQTFRQFFRDGEEGSPVVPTPQPHEENSEEEEEGLVAAGSPSDGNNSGSEEKSECESNVPKKKKSAYSLAPNRVSCPYCSRKFPWSSSLRRHILTHTGQKPYKCLHCPLLFTTKSNCDRHLARKHSNKDRKEPNSSTSSVSPNTLSVTPNSSSTSISPGLSASSRSPPEADLCASTPLSPQSYQMRNVPDRPYKCRHCPSSTFATLSNLRKHVASKHTGSSVESCVMSFEERNRISQSGYESHSSISDDLEQTEDKLSEPEKKVDVKLPIYYANLDSQPLSLCKTEKIDIETKSEARIEIKEVQPLSLCKAPEPEPSGNGTIPSANITLPITAPVVSIPEGPVTRTTDSSVILSSSELPFKCHLCDGSFSERQECLDHIRLNHASEYEVLLSKGALELGVATSPEDNNNDDSHPPEGENLEHLKGKFPDYANRKVRCAFCMHRFWSAEDLRRHMRTHTGERPFFCDVCFKRFTLKHSMLRHWRKHRDLTNNNTNNINNNIISVPVINPSAVSGDEEGFAASLRNPSSRDLILDHVSKLPNHNSNNNIIVNLAAVSRIMRAWNENHNHVSDNKNSLRRRDEEDNALISNLLGVGDPAIIDKVLITKSADDAEKILGVLKSNKRT